MWSRILVFIVASVIVPIVNGGNCEPAAFKGKCLCGYGTYIDRIQYIVNCTNAGFKDTDMLEYMPLQTEVLIFTGNFIQELPWNVFGAINSMENLTIIDMSNNHIRSIRGKSFHHVMNVKRLILNHNNLSISRSDDDVNNYHPRVFSNFINLMELHLTNAFADNSSAELSRNLHDIFVNSNLTKLTKLHLEQNEIKKFDDRRVFCDLPSLKDLHLGDNLLEEINFNVVCLKHLRFLDLERNRFVQLRTRDLNLLDLLENSPGRDNKLVIDLTYNPISCDCTINNIQEWLKKTNVTIRNLDSLKCYRNHRPAELVLSIKTNRCRLQNKHSKQTVGHTVTLVLLLVILSSVLASLLVALAYVSRDRLKKMFHPVLDNVSKKVQYTTIKDDDAPEQYV